MRKIISGIKKEWKENIPHEIYFWDNYIKTRGDRWKKDFKNRTNPNSRLQKIFVMYLNKTIPANRILDVGAGPFTIINKKSPFNIEIFPIDPLADEYDKLLKKHNIKSLIKTQKLEGEKLTEKFNINSFDISFSSNAIDHSYDPLKIINEMIKVTKTGGYIILDHHIREGSHAEWKGLHKWNFYLDCSNDFIIEGRNGIKINMADAYKRRIVLEDRQVNNKTRRFVVVFKKILES